MREEIDKGELKERWERERNEEKGERGVRERIGLSLKTNPSKPTESNCDPTEKISFFSRRS